MSQNGERRYRVEHNTAYRYSEPVLLSHQQLHLTPRALARQRSQTHEIVIMPTPTLRCPGIRLMSLPSKLIRPPLSGRSPEIVFSVVVLPAPFAPISATISPESTCRLTFFRAAILP